MEAHVPTEGHTTFESWAAATRSYQAHVIRAQVETLRKLKYKPTGGFCQFFFADAADMISCSVLDHARRPKEPAFSALAASCRPQIVVADPLPVDVVPGIEHRQNIHVISDLRDAVDEARVDVTLLWPRGQRSWHFAGPLDADSVTKAGDITWIVPRGPGPVTLELTLTIGSEVLSNRYESSVQR